MFTRANVINGEFTYGGAERSTHYSRALVSYDNPANNYDTDVIPVTDVALQRRYRIARLRFRPSGAPGPAKPSAAASGRC